MALPSKFAQYCEIIQVLLSKTNSAGASEEDDKFKNWNLSGLAFVVNRPLNGMVAIRLRAW